MTQFESVSQARQGVRNHLALPNRSLIGLEKISDVLEGRRHGRAPLRPIGQSVLAGGLFKPLEEGGDAHHATVGASTSTTVRETLDLAYRSRRNRRLEPGNIGGRLLEIELYEFLHLLLILAGNLPQAFQVDRG
jgi:hypothetical protein